MPWIDALFKRMVEVGASDLHMTSACKPQLRLHGDMTPIEECAVIRADQMRQAGFVEGPPALDGGLIG